MKLNRIIPRVNVKPPTIVVGQVPSGAQKYSGHVHQLAKRKVSEEHAYQKEMDKEQGADARRHHGMKGDQPDGQLLDRGDVGPVKIPHEEPGDADSQDQKEGEIIRGQGNIAHGGGLPRDANERCALAAEIMASATEHNVPYENIYLDPIMVVVNGQQEHIKEVFESIKMFKELFKIFYAIAIGLICAFIVLKTHRLFRLSHHQGIRYFRNAFLFYGAAFIIRFFVGSPFIYDLMTREVFSLINFVFEFFLIMAGFFLLYNL